MSLEVRLSSKHGRLFDRMFFQDLIGQTINVADHPAQLIRAEVDEEGEEVLLEIEFADSSFDFFHDARSAREYQQKLETYRLTAEVLKVFFSIDMVYRQSTSW